MSPDSSNSFFVFMAADNNLDPAGVGDVEEMCRSDPPGDLNVVIQFDRARYSTGTDTGEATKRFTVEDGQLVEKQDLGETNCGDPAVLHEFLEWGMQEYPAQRNMVVLWNHGGGAKDESPYREALGKDKFPLFVFPGGRRTVSDWKARREAATVPRAGPGKGKEEEEPEFRLVCMDDTSRDFLDNLELKTALTYPGKKFDIVGFDACLMNMVEVIYQLRDIADIVVGSEETEPGTGWPYDTVLSYLKSNKRAGNTELAQKMVALYNESYEGSAESVTQSAVSTGSLAGAARGLDDFAGLLLGSLSTIQPALARILSSVQRFAERDYIDLYDFVLLCQKNTGQKAIEKAASGLIPLLDKAIIANKTSGSSVQDAHGLSIYFPLEQPTREVLDIYEKLDFTAEYPNWLNLIKAYHTSLRRMKR